MLTTPKGLLKPEMTDPADLRIFIGQNMDLIDELLGSGTALAIVKTSSEWAQENPILDVGVFGVEKDTLKLKIGDGINTWTNLLYFTQGEKGDAPAHQWDGTKLQFQNPNGTWGSLIDLRGAQGIQGIQGERGLQGIQGLKGDKPAHQWSGTKLQFQNPDGSWGSLVDLRGAQGIQGERGLQGIQGIQGIQGLKGDKPAHQWSGTMIRFENPDGTWGIFGDLRGEKGDKGDQGIQGLKGDKPSHQWSGTSVRFENPDGSWGTYTNLKGEQGIQGIQGLKGDKPSHQWSGTSVRFENPNGTWGSYVNLKGEQGHGLTPGGTAGQVLQKASATDYDAKWVDFNPIPDWSAITNKPTTFPPTLGTTSTTAYRGDYGNIAYNHSQSAHLALGTTSTTAYRGDYGNIAYNHSQSAHAPANAWVYNEATIKAVKVNNAVTADSANEVVYEGAGLYLPRPKGGAFATATSSVTGAIKITLPVSWTNTMIRFAIDIYNYSSGTSFTVYVGGYNYSSSSSWVNTSAYILGYGTNRDFTVRFGHDGSKCCVYIGETGSTWSYPQIVVRDFYAGYNAYARSTWASGWSVGFATSLGTITSTITNCLVASSVAKVAETANAVAWGNVADKPSTFAPSSHNHDASNITTGTLPVARGGTGNTTGNATTATTLQTARTINGTSFNGSANITTASWGTARTITIGNTGKSVNGSGNVSWSLEEIGASQVYVQSATPPATAGALWVQI